MPMLLLNNDISSWKPKFNIYIDGKEWKGLEQNDPVMRQERHERNT
jgi:hypothetical protein